MTLHQSYNTPDQAVTAAMKYAAEEVFVEFVGMICNDNLDDDDVECCGWDGKSRRCECGNHRVDWNIEKKSEGNFYAIAHAY